MSINEQPMNVYWSGQKSLISNKYKMDYKKLVDGLEPLLNWQKTETASSVTFYPLPATPLNPVVSFTFTETNPVSGVKGTDNPSTITGVSFITVTHCETEGVNSTAYTIDLDGTYYGGTLDVASGKMTVTQAVYEIDSSLTWSDTSTTYVYSTKLQPAIAGTTQNADLFKSSHFTYSKASVASMPANTFNVRTDKLLIVSTDELSLQDFKDLLDAQKLAGTPVVVTYPLATPYTVQLNAVQIAALAQTNKYSPRINTIYTDANTVQVSYAKSPIYSEYELTQAIADI